MRWLDKWKLRTQMWTCIESQAGMIWIIKDDKDDGGKSNVHINFLKCFFLKQKKIPSQNIDWKKKCRITSLNVG